MRKFLLLGFLCSIVLIFLNSFSTKKSPLTLPNAPTNYSGAPTASKTCRNCHSDFSLNSGGSIAITGLPSGSYIPGHVYNFSVTISKTGGASIWSFDMKAVISGTSGTALGTLGSTNANVGVSGSDLRVSSAVSSSGTSYTYNNLKWTAPATGTSSVSFYIAGVAGDGDGSEAGDYVYSNSYLNIVVPVSLNSFTANLNKESVQLNWVTLSEEGTKFFEVDRSYDGSKFEKIATINAKGKLNTETAYQYSDYDLQKSSKIVYYRLNMIDADGKSQYSKVVTVTNAVETYVDRIYPTSINRNGNLHVNLVSSDIQNCTISVYTAWGQKVFSNNQQLNKGLNTIVLNQLGNLSSSIYFISVDAGSLHETKMFAVE